MAQPRLLNDKEKKALEDRISKAISNASSHTVAKSSVLCPGIKYGDGSSFVLVDSAVLTSELSQLLGGTIERICTMLGVELRVLDVSYDLPDDPEFDQFFSGIAVALDAKMMKGYLPSLRIDKKPYELGKTTGFLLRVRGEVVKGAYKNVGLQGLKTCHRYFGNDSSRPESNKDRENRKSQLEHYLMRIFAGVKDFADRYKHYFELLTTLLQELRLQDFEDEEVAKIIDHYQKSFEDVRETFEKPIFSIKKGSKQKVKTGTRRPKRPNSSPTMLMVEFKDFVDPLIGYHWTSLEHYKSSFKENVRTHGFGTTCRDIHDVYESRYEVTRNFSNLTTKRLQEARSYGILGSTSKKTDFNDEVRKEFFAKRNPQNRVTLFVEELKKLVPEKYRYDAIRRLCDGIAGVDNMSPNQLISALSDKVAMAYPRANIEIGNYSPNNPKVTRERENTVRQMMEKLSKTVSLYKLIPGRLRSFRRCVFTRKQLVQQTTNYSLLRNEISELDILLTEDFWTNSVTKEVWKTFYVTETNIRDVEYFRKEVLRSLQTTSKEIKQTFESRDKKVFAPAQDSEAAIKEITQMIENLKLN